MKIDFKKLSKNELIQAFILSIICIYICLFFIECQQLSQKTFYFIIILGAMFNWLPRKEDSTFGQVRIPLITSFAVIMNKIITAINLITNPETVEIFDSEDLHFENSLLMMVFCGVFFLFIIGMFIWSFFVFHKDSRRVFYLESFDSSEGSRLTFSKTVILLNKVVVIVTLVSGIIQTIARPLYNWIITGSIDYICFQKYFLASGVDLIINLAVVTIMVVSALFFEHSFITQQGDFLITDDNRIIKYKGKNKTIFVPKDLRIVMTDTFETCDSSYIIHFEEGTKELPPLKFKKSIPSIYFPSSLTDIREYSLFIKNQNPYDNIATVKMLLKNPVFRIIDGCVVNTKNNTLLFKIDHSSTEFKVPDNIENIGKYAFDDLLLADSYIEEASIKTEIERRSKKYINFINNSGKEFESFAEKAIKNRMQLSKICFNKGIKNVHPEAFEMATGLREIYVPEECDFDILEINPLRPYIKYLGKSKKITHRMIERLLHIHAKIKSGCYPNSKQLAYDLETSEPTINRDIEYLRDSRGAPIQYDFTNRGYYYTEDYELFFDK